MFYTLHRLVKYLCMLFVAGCLFWLYTQREALEPLWVWYDVYDNGGIQKADPLPRLEGQGLAVIDGHTFQMKSGGKIYSVRLTGFEIPTPPLSLEDIQLEKARRELLRKVVVSQPVRVDVTYSNANSFLGIVYIGSTNLNTLYVTKGLGTFNRDYVKSAPRDQQYKFFAAVRARHIERLAALEKGDQTQ